MDNIKIFEGVVKLDDMRRHWWIYYKWENVSSTQEPMYVCKGIRDMEEAAEAARQFDEMWKASLAVKAENG